MNSRFLWGPALCVLALLGGCASGIPQNALLLSPQSLADRQIQTRMYETANYQAMLSSAAGVLQDLGFTLDESEFGLGVLVASKQRDATSAGQIFGSVLLAVLTGQSTQIDKEQHIRVSMVMREVSPPGRKQTVDVQAMLPQNARERIRRGISQAVSRELGAAHPPEAIAMVADRVADKALKTIGDDLQLLADIHGDAGQSTVRITFQRIIYNTAGQVTKAEQINEPVIYQQFFDALSQSVFLEAHEI